MAIEIEKKGKKSPHVALTHNELQGGASNKRNASLLMKSDTEITEDLAILIEKVTGVKVEPTSAASQEDLEKASFETLRKLLGKEIKKFDSDKEYSWSYVEDFDEQYVVFTNDDGLFYATYESTTGGVVVSDTATSVNRVVSYREDSGTLILSEDNVGNSSVQSLIVKSFENIKKNEKLVDVIKSIQEKGKLMEVEIQKAVDEATNALKADLEKANAIVADLQKAAQDVKAAQRKDKISAVMADADKAEELLKATATLDDESFETILKSFQDKVEQIEKSDLFERKGSQEDIEKADQEPLHIQMLKKQHNLS